MTLHSAALVVTGTVYSWGDNAFKQQCDGTTNPRLTPTPIAGLDDVVSVVGGGGHGVVLRTDGSVWAWGRNDHGQVGDGSTTDRLTPVAVPGLNLN